MSIAFGVMGLAMSALILALGPTVQADISSQSADSAYTFVSLTMPTAHGLGMALEAARIATWLTLIVMGFFVLRGSRWSLSTVALSAALLLAVDGMKIIDTGLSFIDLGCAGYGGVLLAFVWHQSRAAVVAVQTGELVEAAVEAESVQTRRAA